MLESEIRIYESLEFCINILVFITTVMLSTNQIYDKFPIYQKTKMIENGSYKASKAMSKSKQERHERTQCFQTVCDGKSV